jgi:hypothetical protein
MQERFRLGIERCYWRRGELCCDYAGTRNLVFVLFASGPRTEPTSQVTSARDGGEKIELRERRRNYLCKTVQDAETEGGAADAAAGKAEGGSRMSVEGMEEPFLYGSARCVQFLASLRVVLSFIALFGLEVGFSGVIERVVQRISAIFELFGEDLPGVER